MHDKNNAHLRFLFFGDLVGKPARKVFARRMPGIRDEYGADAVVVNGENSADNGRGITPSIADFFFDLGVAAITTGNHVWGQRDVHAYLDSPRTLLRPANFPSSCPGKGYCVIDVNGHRVAIMNVQGRVFMHEQLDCPFRTAESLVTMLREQARVIFLDFHAETTSEKQGMGFFLDGKVSGVFGTHTHVQTADERILPGGTGYITDLGFSGSINSMLGMNKDAILHKFLTQMPVRFSVETEGPFAINGICIDVDPITGKAVAIERISILDDGSLP